MAKTNGQFTISFADSERATNTFEKESIFIGRLDTCEIVLDHKTVSRIHAGINFTDSKYFLANLTSSNVLTLNGRLLGPQKDDALADGDTIQVGPFAISVGVQRGAISLVVQRQVADTIAGEPVNTKVADKTPAAVSDMGDVLKVFWEKRNRDKEDWGTRLRPTEPPKPGKAMFNWKPTRDLRPTWRFGLFIWAFLLIGAIGAFAYFRDPEAYAPKPLSNPHSAKIEDSTIAVMANADSCTTCHTLNEPVENSCVKCHSASEFRASNTKAHEEAGVTCTMCHHEHQGRDFDMKATAIQSCAECHNDKNAKTFNGKSVHTPHGGSYGYPVVDGMWKWKGVYREEADAIPEINSSATGDKDDRQRLSRYFHTIHVGRLKAPEGIKGDKRGFISCSSCHERLTPVDVVKPRQTCAVCHTTPATTGRDTRFGATGANCISCHVQHPYSSGRWSEFLSDDALNRRKEAVANKIAQLNGQ